MNHIPKDGPGFFDSLFDLNGDGKTDLDEEFVAFTLFHAMQEGEERKKKADASLLYDLDDLDMDEDLLDLDDLDIPGI